MVSQRDRLSQEFVFAFDILFSIQGLSNPVNNVMNHCIHIQQGGYIKTLVKSYSCVYLYNSEVRMTNSNLCISFPLADHVFK